MNFILTYALWGLAGIAVPLIIHLLSKRKRDLIPFGSLLFLEKTESPSARSIQLSQWWLMALRIAAIVSLVIFVAKPFILTTSSERLVYVEDTLLADPAYENWLDSIAEIDRIQCFSFTESSNSSDCLYFPNMWSLFYAVNQEDRSVNIFTLNKSRYYRGEPVQPAAHVIIHEVPVGKDNTYRDTIYAMDSTYQVSYHSNPFLEETTLKSLFALSPGDRHDTLRVSLPEDTSNDQVHLLYQILREINHYTPVEISIVGPTKEAEWRITTQFGNGFASNVEDVIVWEAFNGPLKIAAVSPHIYLMTGTLNKQSILEDHLPVHLAQLLMKKFVKDEFDETLIDPKFLSTNETMHHSVAALSQHSIASFWLILSLILLIIERLIFQKMRKE